MSVVHKPCLCEKFIKRCNFGESMSIDTKLHCDKLSTNLAELKSNSAPYRATSELRKL